MWVTNARFVDGGAISTYPLLTQSSTEASLISERGTMLVALATDFCTVVAKCCNESLVMAFSFLMCGFELTDALFAAAGQVVEIHAPLAIHFQLFRR